MNEEDKKAALRYAKDYLVRALSNVEEAVDAVFSQFPPQQALERLEAIEKELGCRGLFDFYSTAQSLGVWQK